MTATIDAAAVRDEIRSQCRDNTPAAIVEQIATQTITARVARERIDREGLIINDGKGSPVEHPALKIEATAQKRVEALLRRYARK